MPFPNSSFAQAGRFSAIRPVGSGGAGQVYYAEDNLGRAVAIKEGLPLDQSFLGIRAKFQKEARLQAALQHPNIVAVYHLEEDPESQELYLICEFASGGSLADHLERHGPLDETQAIMVAIDICAALEATWSRQIVHRDVKPSNILLFCDVEGRIAAAKLGDFGIAQDHKARRTTALPGATHPGTPLYMAPEQGNIASVLDVRADLYALGVTLWELLTGKDYKLLLAQEHTPDLRAHCPTASAGLAAVLKRMLQEDPALRYPTPEALAADLRAVRDGAAPTQRLGNRSRSPLLASGLGLATLAAAGALAFGWPNNAMSTTPLATRQRPGTLVVLATTPERPPTATLAPTIQPSPTLWPSQTPSTTPQPSATLQPSPMLTNTAAPTAAAARFQQPVVVDPSPEQVIATATAQITPTAAQPAQALQPTVGVEPQPAVETPAALSDSPTPEATAESAGNSDDDDGDDSSRPRATSIPTTESTAQPTTSGSDGGDGYPAPEPTSAPKPTSESTSEAEPTSAPKPTSEPEPKPSSEPEPKPSSEPEPKPSSEPEPKPSSEARSGPDSGSTTKPGPGASEP